MNEFLKTIFPTFQINFSLSIYNKITFMAKIEIKKDVDGYRHFAPTTYSVSYEKDGFEIDGTLKPYGTGRGIDYEFEPNSFQDDETQAYYSDNWEQIEKEIKDHFYNTIRS